MWIGTRIGVVAVLGAGMAVAGGGGPAAASGGGGCGGPMTEGTGSTVVIRRSCFTPTVLHVAPGTDVSFVNRDPLPHNVLGAGGEWGSFERLPRRAPATYRFEQEGTFAYACLYHPGMIGTVVVGNGVGGGTAVDIRPVAAVEEAPAPAASTPAQAPASGWKTATGVTVGLLLLVLAAAAGQRRHLLGRR